VTPRQERDSGAWLRRHPTILTIVLGTLGVLFVIVGVLGVNSGAADRATLHDLRAGEGITVTGTMVGSKTYIEEGFRSRPDRARYCPRYAYTGADGAERTLINQDGCESSESSLTVKTVDILVDTTDSSIAFIDEDDSSVGRTSSWILSWAFLLLGSGLVVATPIVGVRLLRGRRKRKRTAPRH